MKRFAAILLCLMLLLTGCGAYTPAGEATGNAELDAQVLTVLEEVCEKDNSLSENAALVYNWVANEIKYRASTADLSEGYTEEVVQELALDMLTKRRGACDGEAALMAVLLRRMGCEAVVVEGTFLRDADTEPVEHAWVIAKVDGAYYHFDPLYGKHYAEDRMGDYCMAADEMLQPTHQWDQAAYPVCG